MADKNIYTVVVADDEDELREAVCTMIPWEALGFHLVGNASNGLDALELVERLEPDLLLTDIRSSRASSWRGRCARSALRCTLPF